jgi:hypothetical protein
MDKRKMFIPILATGILTLIVAAGAFTYHTVNAQASTPTPSMPAAPAGRAPGFPDRELKLRGGAGGGTQQDLADALGVDLAALQDAQQTAAEKALAEAVSQGLITQAQADTLKERGLNGRMLGGPWMKDGSINYQTLLADALGISANELEAAQQTAAETALARSVANGDITQEQADLMQGQQALADDENFQSAMQTAYESAVKQAVTDGVITQAQADAILENSDGNWMGKRSGLMGPPGFGGRFHGRGGDGSLPMPGVPSTPDATAAPEGGL